MDYLLSQSKFRLLQIFIMATDSDNAKRHLHTHSVQTTFRELNSFSKMSSQLRRIPRYSTNRIISWNNYYLFVYFTVVQVYTQQQEGIRKYKKTDTYYIDM